MKSKVLKNIKIEKIGYGGIGIGNVESGKKVLISGGALPGQVVDIKITKKKKDYISGHIIKIHSYDKTLQLIPPRCPHFFNNFFDTAKPAWKIGCGGCKWQILPYEKQVELKKQIIEDAFSSFIPNFKVTKFLASPLKFNYRNKIEFSFGKFIENKNGITQSWTLGFHKQGEYRKVVDIDSCFLVSPQVNEIFGYLKQKFSSSGLPVYDVKINEGFFRHLLIRQAWNRGEFLVNLSVADEYLEKTGLHNKWEKLLSDLKNDEFLKNKIKTFVISYNNGFADVIQNKDTRLENLWGNGEIVENLSLFLDFDKLEEKVGKFIDYSFDNGQNKRQIEFIDKNGSLEESESLDLVESENFIQESDKEGEIKAEKTVSKKRGEISFEQFKELTKDLEKVELSFKISSFSFFQTNTLGAEVLFSKAYQFIKEIKTGIIVDLYCGTGTIGQLFLKAGVGEKLVGIEIYEPAIQDARKNAELNGLQNKSEFYALPVEKSLDNKIRERVLPDTKLIIVDPPRDGLHPKVVNFLLNKKEKFDFNLLYISCNPITLSRDLQILQQKFQLKNYVAVDLFPQTHHIENIAYLQ